MTTTKDTPWDITLTRTPLFYAGVAAITGGILMATVWADVPASPSIEMGPGHVRISKTVGW